MEIVATSKLRSLVRPIVPTFVFGWSFPAAKVVCDIHITEALGLVIHGAAEQPNLIHEITKLGVSVDLRDPFQKLGNDVVDLRPVNAFEHAGERKSCAIFAQRIANLGSGVLVP